MKRTIAVVLTMSTILMTGAAHADPPPPQDIQAPRGQEIQAPRGQEIQAPRGDKISMPRD